MRASAMYLEGPKRMGINAVLPRTGRKRYPKQTRCVMLLSSKKGLKGWKGQSQSSETKSIFRRGNSGDL